MLKLTEMFPMFVMFSSVKISGEFLYLCLVLNHHAHEVLVTDINYTIQVCISLPKGVG